MMIDSFIEQRLPTLQCVPVKNAHFDTALKLRACAEQRDWVEEDFQLLDFISKRIEISRCLYDSYLASGGRATTQRLAPEWQAIALLLLLKDFLRLQASGENINAIKKLNAILKLHDHLQPDKNALEDELKVFIATTADEFLRDFQPTAPDANESMSAEPDSRATKTIALTVLFWEGPIARAYLATLKSMGLQPEKIVHLVSKNDLSSKKPVGRFLPGVIRMAYAESRQKSSIHYWSTTLQKTETALHGCMRAVIERDFNFSKNVVDDALELNHLSSYSTNVEQLLVDGLADEHLHRYLQKLPDSRILFTGGGIVPKRLLEIEHLKFIHVHPGYLPEVRGADCALWSQLVKGRTSATCFYMAPGIDDGDVIVSAYLPALRFDLEKPVIDMKSLYRATYAFFDPWVRANVLRRTINLTSGFAEVNATTQIEEGSFTYHFMHERIQQAAFSRLFNPIAR
jgi:hypothetical protein